jgi:hypothetical protein
MDADTGEIVAATLMTNDIDDAGQIDPLLDLAEGRLISFTGDGAYDHDSVYRAVTDRDPAAAVVVPPRNTAAASESLTPNPHSVIAISSVLPRRAGSAGKKCQAVQASNRRCCAFEDERRATEVTVAACHEPHVGGVARSPSVSRNSHRVGGIATHSLIRATTPPVSAFQIS